MVSAYFLLDNYSVLPEGKHRGVYAFINHYYKSQVTRTVSYILQDTAPFGVSAYSCFKYINLIVIV